MKHIKSAAAIICPMIALAITGCGGNRNAESPAYETLTATIREVETPAASIDETIESEEMPTEVDVKIEEADWADYFHGLHGAAVVFIPDEHKYMVYQEELSKTQRSPCSTFKIISSLIGIEAGVIKDAHSIRTWDGEKFWNEAWNRDIGFQDAFQSSCIWYFREVIDELGPDRIQEELELLNYGNRDCSDWAGKLNNQNNNPALTGFWVESSLRISAKEQAEVMERIFGEDSVYRPKTLELLKDAMLVTDADASGPRIFGKTGMGKSHGVTVDAWYTGFAETDEKKAYFCVYIGESGEMDVSSAEAKKIALQIIKGSLPAR